MTVRFALLVGPRARAATTRQRPGPGRHPYRPPLPSPLGISIVLTYRPAYRPALADETDRGFPATRKSSGASVPTARARRSVLEMSMPGDLDN